ncbi:hypothetical protein HF313_15120 [Massilia atriviolacea]|uniref:Uncharacterized protein n=1 Tax=Massilia atriviolacea TaxID=2495579 RepID=A0A430HRA8_9BURK|nr:hypothetical protein [Massilia atriviolacea]RSZ60043.1 hypothetical protein EJB06_07640 [Massilia atriviolacea]
MRTPNLGTVNYTPGQVPASADDLLRFVREEFDKVSGAITLLAAGHLDPQTVAPLKPRDGDIRYAAGAPHWNPGSGRGVYIFKLTTWVFLG